jgi:hypothetical protein
MLPEGWYTRIQSMLIVAGNTRFSSTVPNPWEIPKFVMMYYKDALSSKTTSFADEDEKETRTIGSSEIGRATISVAVSPLRPLA